MSEPLDIELHGDATMHDYYEKWPLKVRQKIDQMPCDKCGKVATRIVIDKSTHSPIDPYEASARPNRLILCEPCCRKLHGWEAEQ